MIDDKEPFGYLELIPAHDAPLSDNPSGLYCPTCRSVGLSHCAHPEWCGGMRKMRETAIGPKPMRNRIRSLWLKMTGCHFEGRRLRPLSDQEKHYGAVDIQRLYNE